MIHAPDALPLGGVVHVWRADTATLPPADPDVLSAAERERAERFHFEKHRRAYVQAHVMLRRVLAHYAASGPGDLQFEYGTYGKPLLKDCEIRFNLSHSADFVVVAVALAEVGIDVEQMRQDVNFLEVAEGFFSPRERAMVARAGDSIARVFYRIWTCKEAYMKARGMGFSLPSHTFDVCGEGGPGVLNTRDQAEWSLSEFDCADGYAAAVVAAGSNCALEIYDYPGLLPARG